MTWINAQTPATDRGIFLAEPDGTILAGAGLWPWASQSTLPEAVMSALAGREGALIESSAADGPAWKCALAHPASGWIAGVCDAGADDEWAGSALLLRLAVAGSSLLAAAGSAAALARRLMGPIQRLARQAELLSSGIDGTSQTPPFAVAEFEALRLALARAAAILQQRQAAEQMALREAQTGYELLMSVLNNAADQIQLTDRDLRYVMVNRATLASLGMPGQESRVLGRRASEILPPETGQRVEELDAEVLATGEHRVLEMDWSVPGMAPRIVATTKSPWRDVAGQVSGVVTILRDVTAQRGAEARLRAVQADLLRATRLSAMGAMGSGLAHELNQPLAAATNFLNAAARMLDSVDDVRDWARVSGGVREAVGEAAAQMLRAGAIVRSLRQFVERGEIELDIADLAPLVREACDLARADGAIGAARLVAWFPETVGLALVDRTQMHQVLLNLIRNAAEALEGKPDGRIVVSATRDSTSLPGGALVITVTDNGPGLDPDVAGRLFEPFVSTKPTGLGIGLAISRTIVEGHGGRLLAEPAEGGGTVFRILLPAVQPPATRDLILSEPKAGS